VAFSPDGKTLVSGGDLDDVRLWDVATGRELRHFPADPKGRVTALTFSPDGALVASAHWKSTCTEGMVRCWQVRTGKEVRQLSFPATNPVAVAFSPDSKALVTGSTDSLVWLHEVATGKRLYQLGQVIKPTYRPGVGMPSAAFAFSPDGKRLTTVQANLKETIPVVRVWDLESARELRGIRNLAVRRGAIAPDGKTFALAHHGEVEIWDLPTGKKTHLIKTEHPGIVALAFSADGKVLAIANAGHSVTLWATATGKPLFPVSGHSREVRSIAFSPDGKLLASAGRDGLVRLWDPRQGTPTRPFGESSLVGHCVAFSPNGKTLASTTGWSIGFWEKGSGKEQVTIKDLRTKVSCVAYSPDGTTLATGDYIGPFGMGFNDDGAGLGSDAGAVLLFDVATGKQLFSNKCSDSPVDWKADSIAFAPDGKALATSHSHRVPHRVVRLWSLAVRKELFQLEIKPEKPDCIRSDGTVTPGVSGWDGSAVAPAVFSPGGKTLAAVTFEGRIQIWETATGKERARLPGRKELNGPIAFSPTGGIVATGSRDGAVSLWEAATGREVCRYVGHQGEVLCVTFSPDGKTLASGSADTTILLWEVKDWSTAKTLAAKPLKLEPLWTDLLSKDAEKAYRAMKTLMAVPERAVPFLKTKLEGALPSPNQLRRWLTDLDNDRYGVRKQATMELSKLGVLVEPGLRRLLAEKPTLEVRHRVEGLLKSIAADLSPPSTVVLLRALEVLESLNTAEARKVLEDLVKGIPQSLLSQEAQASLSRLTGRPLLTP
jgi:WD40 repeat protein